MSIKKLLLGTLLFASLVSSAADVPPVRTWRSWTKPCAIVVVAAVAIVGGIRWTRGQLDLAVVKEVIARSDSQTRILGAKTQSEVMAEAILLARASSTSYLATPKTVIDDVEEYLTKQKWIKPRYPASKSVASQVFDYVDRYKRDSKVHALVVELRGLPYGKVHDEDWFEIGTRHLGVVIPDYDTVPAFNTGLAWNENRNLRTIWKRTRTGFTDDERQALVSYILLEQYKYSGNKDLLYLLLYAPGFLEAVEEQPENYADWISKAARHLKRGDLQSAKAVGQAMRHMKTGAVVDVLEALGPECFRTFMKESRHHAYAEQVVRKDVATYRPILRAMLLSTDPHEVDTAKEIVKEVPELAGELP